MKKRGFTLLEFVVSIIIISGIGLIIFNTLNNLYKNIFINNEYYNINNKVNILNYQFHNILENVPYNTLIGVKCKLDNNSDKNCFKGENITNNDFDALNNNNYIEINASQNYDNEVANKDNIFQVVEFYTFNEGTRFPSWDENLKQNVYHNNNFVDLIDTKQDNNNNSKYEIIVRGTDFDKVNILTKKYLSLYGINENPFENNNSVILFSGNLNLGDIVDINNSYGYYGTKKLVLYSIDNYKVYHGINYYNNYTDLNISNMENYPDSDIYQKFYIINTAEAIVPKINKNGLIDLYLFRFYKPWKGETYKDARQKLLLFKNLYSFKLRKIFNFIDIKVCYQNKKLNELTNNIINICRSFSITR